MDVRIRRLDCTYQVTASAERAEEVQRRLDRVAKELLGQALERSFTGVEGAREAAAGETLIFIDRMEADVSLEAALANGSLVMDDYNLAKKWAAGLQDAIRRTVQAGGGQVIVFQSRGEYLASYIHDRMNGRDGGLWYYAEFEPLRGMADGAAYGTILAADEIAGHAALLSLAQRGDLESLLNAMKDDEVDAVVAICLLPSAPPLRIAGSMLRWMEGLQGLLSTQKLVLSGQPSRDLARLYLLLLKERPDLGPDVHLARFLNDLLRLRSSLPDRSWQDLARRLESGDWPRARQLASAYPALVAQIQGDRCEATAADVLRRLGRAEKRSAGNQSACAGALLLLPAALELDLYEFFRNTGWDRNKPQEAASMLLMAVLAQVAGAETGRMIWHDAMLCRVMGMQTPPGTEAFERLAQDLRSVSGWAISWEEHWKALTRQRGFFWHTGGEPASDPSPEGLADIETGDDGPQEAVQRLNAALHPVSARLAQRFASALGNFAGSSLPYLRRNFLDGPGTLEFAPGQVLCRLPNRPLALVLKMTGYENRAISLPWLEGQELEYRFE